VLLRKIARTRFAKLTRQYFAWTGFVFLLLVLNTAISSLDLIKINNYALFDVILTYALLIALAFLDAFIIAAALAGLEVLAEKLLHRNLEKFFRIPVMLGFIVTWIYLLISFFPTAGGV
jgi:uncharacterized membrane protein